MNTSEVLNRAADLIEERGWIAGEGWVYETSAKDQKLCLEGGIMAALGMQVAERGSDGQFKPLYTCPAYRAVSDYLGREAAGVEPSGYGFTGQPLYWWNDEQESPETVIATLRAAAVIEAAKENAEARESVPS